MINLFYRCVNDLCDLVIYSCFMYLGVFKKKILIDEFVFFLFENLIIFY